MDLIHTERCIYPLNDKWIYETCEETEKRVLLKNPSAHVFYIDITFPRCDRRVLWTDSTNMLKTKFISLCETIRDNIFSRLCEY